MRTLNVAVIPLQRLGDGIISLVLANNLHNNHFEITLYHDFMVHLEEWFAFTIKPYPEHSQLPEELSQYDIVLMDMCVPYVLEQSQAQQELLSEQYIFYAVGRLQDCFAFNHYNRLYKKLGKEYEDVVRHFSQAARTIKYDRYDSMVDNFEKYCRETLKLPHVSRQTGISIPDSLCFQKEKKRVVIAPTSSLKKKNWPPVKFIQLARMLKKDGFNPVFAVSPDEREEWLSILSKEDLALPEFTSIKDYAEYLYQSGTFIGNDSGGGHLASLVGLPVLTIVTSPRKVRFKWRPGWGINRIVAPFMTISLAGKRYWTAFLSFKKVYQAFIKLVDETDNSRVSPGHVQ